VSVKEGTSGFIDRLESMRGMAALWVAIGHSFAWLKINDEAAVWSKPLWEVHGGQATVVRLIVSCCSGAAAVDIFFILSGFVLARSFARSALLGNGYIVFLVKRFFRIMPVFWFSIFLASLYLVILYPGHQTFAPASRWFNGFFYEASLLPATILKNASFIRTDLSPNAWTLRIEMVGSLAVPLMVYLLAHKGTLQTFGIVAAFFALSLSRVLPFEDGFLYMFCIGAVLAKFADGGKQVQFGNVVFVACAILIILTNCSLPLVHSTKYDLLVVLPSAILIWRIAAADPASLLSVFDFRWMRWIGKVSYSFYLLHFLVLYGITNGMLHILPSSIFVHWPVSVMAASCIASILLSLALSAVSYSLIEKPMTLLGRKLVASERGVSYGLFAKVGDGMKG
jgi:peptidoglycan/LPS O-acetylase OafA/YrhL